MMTFQHILSVVVLFVFFSSLQFQAYSGHLNFLIMTVSNASSIGAAAIAPGFSVALEDMAVKYPAIFRNYNASTVEIAPPEQDPCNLKASWLVTERISQLYGAGVLSSSNGQQVILTSACLPPFPVIADFAREEDILVLSCGPAHVLNTKRYSTVMATFPGGSAVMGQSLATLTDIFKWKRLSIMLDTVDVRVTEIFNGLMVIFTQRASEFDILTTKFDSGVENEPYLAALKEVSQHSRIIITLTLDGFIRKIMESAVQLKMTTGYYVFVYVYSLQIPGEPPIIWKYRSEELHQSILHAMDSMLVLRYESFDWNSWKITTDKIQHYREQLFGLKLHPEMKFNEMAIGCYEAVEVLAQLLNESQSTIWQPQDVVKQVANRTFSLPNRDVSFAADGRRIPQVVLQQYSSVLKDFEVVMSFNSLNSSWFFTSKKRLEWKSGKLPLDRHKCGFRNELCPPSSLGFRSAVVTVAILCVLVVVFFTIRYHKMSQESMRWWKLNVRKLKLSSVPRQPNQDIY